MGVGDTSIALAPRLKVILSLLGPCTCLADIGSDHAYVIAQAVMSGLAQRGVAVEISSAPYEQSRLTISTLNLGSSVDVRLGNGLEPLQLDEADSLCIAGMGGKNIVSILSSGKEKLTKIDQMILQPNVDAHLVRSFLTELGFQVATESLVEDGNYIYQVIKAVPGSDRHDYVELDYIYGKEIIAKGGPLFERLLERDLDHWQSVCRQLSKSQKDSALMRKEQVEQRIIELSALLNESI